MKKTLSAVLAICLLLAAAPAALAAETEMTRALAETWQPAAEKTLILTENWQLTGDLGLDVPAGTRLTIDGGNRFYIYEMGGVMENRGGGTVYLKDTLVYAAGDVPAIGSLAELSKTARTLAVPSPAKDATSLALPANAAIKSSSNTGVINANGAVTPPPSATAVRLVLAYTDAAGNSADSGYIDVLVPARTPQSPPDGGDPGDGGGTASTPSPTPAPAGNGGGSPGSSGSTAPTPNPTPASSPAPTSTAAGNGGARPGGEAAAAPGAAEVVAQIAVETAPAALDGNGRAVAKVEAPSAMAAVEQAKEAVGAAKAGGKANAVAEIIIPARIGPGASGTAARAIAAELPAEAIIAVAGAKDIILTVESDIAAVTLDAAALARLAAEAKSGAAVTIGAETVDSAAALNPRQQAIAGGNLAVSLEISVGNTAIRDFGGNAAVSVPYTPKAGTAADFDLLTVYSLGDDGSIQEMKNAKYSASAGKITFTAARPSIFFIAEWISPFGDIAKSDWFYKSARHAYSNGLIAGTDKGFEPQAALTRAMLVTILARDAGV
ncbi:MAG: S-layer homology domain-containing protein, partial [Clostridiales bacterium]|nr:S-layer homology domain-containing protein [Clostridiales bacterium]